MFWTCSLIFSSIFFISITILVILISLDFEPIVFVSLFISWTIKSSFLPIGSFNFNVSLTWLIWLFSLIISSSTVALSANIQTSVAILFSSTSTFPNKSFNLSSSFCLNTLGMLSANSSTLDTNSSIWFILINIAE